jgi:SAM-dependent methyltransferase
MDPISIVKNSVWKLLTLFFGKDYPRLLLLRKMPKKAVCAEIGVWKGDYSDRILNITSPQKLHLIDPWEFQSEFSERMYGGAVAKSQGDMDLIYEGVKKRFSEFQNVILNKGKSEKVLQEFPDRYFDWVYLDGNHYYDYVLEDLEICFSKVRKGGIIAGDDYTWGVKDGFPVKRAVHDFIAGKGLKNNLTVIVSQFMIEL